MEKKLMDLFRLLVPMGKEKRSYLRHVMDLLPSSEHAYVKRLLRLNRIGVTFARFGISKKLVADDAFPQIHLAVEDDDMKNIIEDWNITLMVEAQKLRFESFSHKAADIIPSLVAPHIVGFDQVKLAAAWQLFSPERFHILLLGDPGTGKTEILRATAQFAPKSSFGLGSGTSGVGLVGAKKGGEFVLGLLPAAHQGVCCIDELNLMKPKDRGALLNAMEKGFVTYDKGTTHKRLPAKVRILATANPKGDRFIGKKVEFLKKQLPFDPALLSRFHLIFLVRKPDLQQFMKIAKSIVNNKDVSIKSEDRDFVRDYVAFAEQVEVEFNPALEPVITDFFEDVLSKEKDLLVDLSPRLVVGVVRMAKAVARMSLRHSVTHEDVVSVLRVFDKSLRITDDLESKKKKSHKA